MTLKEDGFGMMVSSLYIKYTYKRTEQDTSQERVLLFGIESERAWSVKAKVCFFPYELGSFISNGQHRIYRRK